MSLDVVSEELSTPAESGLAVVTEKYSDLNITETDNSGSNLVEEDYNGFLTNCEDVNFSEGDCVEEIDLWSNISKEFGVLPGDQTEIEWRNYWEEKGEEIVNKSWVEKYKDYINPDFDLSTLAGSGVTELVESSKEKDCGSDTDVVEEDCSTKVSEEELNEADTSSLWLAEWQNHYSEVYYRECRRFFEAAKAEAEIIAEMQSKSLKKYWVMRYHLFSKYDDGIKLDEESWFSVTPETIAKHIAARCRRVDGVIVDAFCGCGGNTIHFAKKFSKVISIDIDPVKIEYAKHNASIYGVQDKIEFIVGNYLHLAPYLKADVVFLSPPWGGPEYANVPIFDLKKMKPLDGYTIFEATKGITNNIAFYVPRNTNKHQLMQLAGDNNFVEIERNMFKNKVKAVTAYYGDLIKPKALEKIRSSSS